MPAERSTTMQHTPSTDLHRKFLEMLASRLNPQLKAKLKAHFATIEPDSRDQEESIESAPDVADSQGECRANTLQDEVQNFIEKNEPMTSCDKGKLVRAAWQTEMDKKYIGPLLVRLANLCPTTPNSNQRDNAETQPQTDLTATDIQEIMQNKENDMVAANSLRFAFMVAITFIAWCNPDYRETLGLDGSEATGEMKELNNHIARGLFIFSLIAVATELLRARYLELKPFRPMKVFENVLSNPMITFLYAGFLALLDQFFKSIQGNSLSSDILPAAARAPFAEVNELIQLCVGRKEIGGLSLHNQERLANLLMTLLAAIGYLCGLSTAFVKPIANINKFAKDQAAIRALTLPFMGLAAFTMLLNSIGILYKCCNNSATQHADSSSNSCQAISKEGGASIHNIAYLLSTLIWINMTCELLSHATNPMYNKTLRPFFGDDTAEEIEQALLQNTILLFGVLGLLPVLVGKTPAIIAAFSATSISFVINTVQALCKLNKGGATNLAKEAIGYLLLGPAVIDAIISEWMHTHHSTNQLKQIFHMTLSVLMTAYVFKLAISASPGSGYQALMASEGLIQLMDLMLKTKHLYREGQIDGAAIDSDPGQSEGSQAKVNSGASLPNIRAEVIGLFNRRQARQAEDLNENDLRNPLCPDTTAQAV